MPVKVALCDKEQSEMAKIQALIKIHPRSTLFEVTYFSTAKELLAQSVVYDLLITDIQKDPEDIDGLELASKLSTKIKIVIFTYLEPEDVCKMMTKYQFEIFEYIPKGLGHLNTPQINRVLEKYLAYHQNPKRYKPFLPRVIVKMSATLETEEGGERTIYLDDILYLMEKTVSFNSQVIITTVQGTFTVKGDFKQLPKVFEVPQFLNGEDGVYMINMDNYTLDKPFKTMSILACRDIEASYQLSENEFKIASAYFMDLATD